MILMLHYKMVVFGRADEGELAPSSKKVLKKKKFLTSLRDYEPCAPIK